MTHIKKTDEFIKEMASYKKTWKNDFRSLLNHHSKYSDYQYTGNIVQSPFYDKMGCVILPFTKNTKLLPVLVWKDRQEDVETPMSVFIRQIKEFEIQQGDTLKDVLDIVGTNFRYDVKIEIHGIDYKGTEEQNNFIVNEFEKYKLDYSKGDKKVSIIPVDYNDVNKETVIATNDNISQLIKEAIEQYGNNADLNFIDTSNVTNMSGLFYNSKFDGDISKWNVSNVKYMNDMFFNSYFNGDISQWNVSKVTNMINMFRKSKFNGDISQWDVSNVMYMNCMFYDSNFNGDISQWNVSSVESMNSIFDGSPLKSNPPKWYTID